MPSQNVYLTLPTAAVMNVPWPVSDNTYTRYVTIDCAYWLSYVFATAITAVSLDSATGVTISNLAFASKQITFTQTGGAAGSNNPVQISLTVDGTRREVLSFEVPIAVATTNAFVYARLAHAVYVSPDSSPITGNQLQTEINARTAGDTAEASTRAAADNAEANARAAADSANAAVASAEILRAQAAEAANASALATEVSNRAAAVLANAQGDAAETAARIAADSAEAALRVAAATAASTSIAAEVSRAQAAEAVNAAAAAKAASDATAAIAANAAADSSEAAARVSADNAEIAARQAAVAANAAADLVEQQARIAAITAEAAARDAEVTSVAALTNARFGYISLDDYSPIKDGTGDNRTALQNAITAARNLSGAALGKTIEIVVNPGIYAMNTAIQAVDSSGNGLNIKLIGRGKPTLKNVSATSGNMFNVGGNNFTLENFIIDANSAAHINDRQPVFTGTNIARLTIRNCDFLNTSSGIHVTGCSEMLIERNKFVNSFGHGIYLSGSYDSTMRDNDFTDLTYFGVILTHASYRCLITGNRTTRNGIELACAEANCYENRFHFNHAENTGDNGLSITGFKNSVVGNICKGVKGNGIHIYGDRNTVTGNICINNAVGNAGNTSWRCGIALQSAFGGLAQQNVVSGNICDDETGTQLYGIWVGPAVYQSWAPGQVIATSGYNTPQYRYYGNNLYASNTNTGTTGNTPPTHTAGDVSDDVVIWTFLRSGFVNGLGAFANEIVGNNIARAAIAKYLDVSGGTGATANEISASFQPLVLPPNLTAGTISNAGGLATVTISNPTAYQTSSGSPITLAVSPPNISGGQQATAAVSYYNVLGFGSLATSGAGYAVGDVLTIAGGTPYGGPATAIRVTAVAAGGAVSTFTSNSGSFAYSTLPPTGNATYTTTGGGSGFTTTPTQFRIGAVVVTSAGSGYTAPPTVSGSGATVGAPTFTTTTSAQIIITAAAGNLLLDGAGTHLGVNGVTGAPVIAEGSIIDGSGVRITLVSGTAYTLPVNTSLVKLIQSSAIAFGSVVLPAAIHDGQKIEIVNLGGPISSFNFTTTAVFGFTNGQPLGYGQKIEVFYDSTDAKWYNAASIDLPQTVLSAGRNLVHNSSFRVNQRLTASVTANGGYPVDRWIHLDAAAGSRTVSQVGLTDADRTAIGDELIVNAVRIQTTGSSGSTDFEILAHRIEGLRSTSNRPTIISFYAKAGTAGQVVSTELQQNFGNSGSPSATVTGLGVSKFTLTTSYVRYYVYVTPTSVLGKTFGPNDYLELDFWTSSGSSFNSRNGTIGVQTSDVYITGVQVEVGGFPTPFERVNLQTELVNCQRFFIPVSASYRVAATSTTIPYGCSLSWPVMRIAPAASLMIAGNVSTNLAATTFNAYTAGFGFFQLTANASGDLYTLNAIYGLTADL